MANASTNTVHNAFNATTQMYFFSSDAVTQTNAFKTQSCQTVHYKAMLIEFEVSASTDDFDLEPVSFPVKQTKRMILIHRIYIVP